MVSKNNYVQETPDDSSEEENKNGNDCFHENLYLYCTTHGIILTEQMCKNKKPLSGLFDFIFEFMPSRLLLPLLRSE